MKETKTIRVSQDIYEELLSYKAELEIINRRPLSFDDAIDLLFNEIAGLEHELGSERVKAKRSASATDAE
jgi:predicted CopG family antitoxin